MADSGLIAIAGAVVGGGLTGVIALLQARGQHRFDTFKTQEERKWNERVTAKERENIELTKRRDELVQIYTRYQLAADRLENAVRELAEAGCTSAVDEAPKEHLHDAHVNHMEAFEAAQDEYDEVCELIKLVAPSKTVKAALQQRQLFNHFVIEALNDSYDHQANYNAIVEAATPVLSAMRSDLRSPE